MHTAILDGLWVEKSYAFGRAALLALAGTLILYLSAKIQVPFYPVPMTLQTLAVLLIATLGGLRLGTMTIVLYLAEGAVGLPVFAGGGGLAYMVGPTGGYLCGFALAGLVLGYGVQRGWAQSFSACLLLMLVAMTLIYLLGFLWLGNFIGYEKAFYGGVTPFILGDILKILLAALSIRILRSENFGGIIWQKVLLAYRFLLRK